MVAVGGESARAKTAVYVWRIVNHDKVMTWIRIIPRSEADQELADEYERIYALYPPEYDADVPSLVKPEGTIDSITAAHSLIPRAMEHAMSAFAGLLSPDLPLTRKQHEMITTVVSALNSCYY
jgi:hypothetical protein